MKRKIASVTALALAGVLALAACSSGGTPAPAGAGASTNGKGKTITLWLVGADTPDVARQYLKDEFAKETKGTLDIQQQDWGDIVTKLTTSLPDANNTPDVTEMGNTQSPTFTNVGAFLDITNMYQELGGSKLLQGFVDAGKVDGKNYTLPYYFGSRYVFYRKDVWAKAGITTPPTTLEQFNTDVAIIAAKNPAKINNFSGFYLGGQDWRDGVSWIFANGGDIAKQSGGKWVGTLEDPNSLKGLTQLQAIYKNASKAPNDAKDSNQYIYLNDDDAIPGATPDDKATPVSLSAATIMAPGWAHWSIGVKGKTDGKVTRTWDDKTFGVFPLPGVDGKAAPVFAGGSNIGISAKSKNPGLAKTLLKIIFSKGYQELLGKNGLGPANSDYTASLGNDEFASALVTSAAASKLTPAAPGWASVEAAGVLEEFFSKIKDSTDLAALAKEYDAKLTPMLNAK
ncbi:MAG: transporter, solute-binding protein [Glaciihabitans sp.]|jgi:N,N'-diacetylchitobiose transport system substrate-binding protein|nr:transporter, solute-binding protein [Glaciihabitans sp.]MCU1533654.1 transporter, solute-binding protein [Glaciihabitans sp.]MDQ1555714.1 N,N-diacetylchitobiose transport system substrate-binding protein [Actinomycetota bacterium]